MENDPLDMLIQEHERQERICQILELTADGLPNAVDVSLVNEVLTFLKRDLPTHIRDEEDGLFPLLEKRVRPDDNFDDIVAQLALEHNTDEGLADELVEVLEALVDSEMSKNPNTLGYMLRAFFETHRRHLAWENAVVLPLARKQLKSDDLKNLDQIMLAHRK